MAIDGKKALSLGGGGLVVVVFVVIGLRMSLPRLFSGEAGTAAANDAPPGERVLGALELGEPVLGVLRLLHQPSCKAPGQDGERWVFRAKPSFASGCTPRGRDLELTVDPLGRIVAFRIEAAVAEVRTPDDMERFRKAYRGGK